MRQLYRQMIILFFLATKQQLFGFDSEHVCQKCLEEIRISESHLTNKFYLESDHHDNTILTVLCDGLVTAKSQESCHGSQSDITEAWDATCGNVAFMPCNWTVKRHNLISKNASFDVCLAGFPDRKLVYDERKGERFFKVTKNTENGYVQLKAYVHDVTENQVTIGAHDNPTHKKKSLEVKHNRRAHDIVQLTSHNPHSHTRFILNVRFMTN